ncbi:ribose-5-phosphate isomerase RpiA [Lichenibacterium minor]|uniref:Ribose-5-phosphate isomerase A n=1 Tax=Lichenibacterium minor TaxID=2316528 RepID=A0A4Q2UF56_9HYPH|nr:ribose-5-phosphate isomerase RpiA [Lichenibacterium minor]RYC33756.1 ribose-5-phosphate isomerase RpiA [Lichenibacterium minor]
MADQPDESSKRRVAARALAFVEDGMRLGLGTGSTAQHFVELLAERVRGGLDVVGVPTSERTRLQAESLGIRLATLDDLPELDLTVDGADEFDPELRLIKGGGGALLREKIVASASARMIVIADSSKRVARLGGFPLPVEVNAFGLASTRRKVERAGEAAGARGSVSLRHGPDGSPYLTDGGHLILDCRFDPIPDPEALAERLVAIPGVVEHGLFIGLASAVVTDGDAGTLVVERPSPQPSRT